MNSVVRTVDMTFPLWGLVIFIVWTIAVVIFLLVVRIRHLSAGGSVKDLARQTTKACFGACIGYKLT